jgi:hypothetical protein
MKHLDEIVRELCWNSSLDDATNYLVADRDLEIEYSDIEKVNSVIGKFIDLVYHESLFEIRPDDMNGFVDRLEEVVWQKYNTELKSL